MLDVLGVHNLDVYNLGVHDLYVYSPKADDLEVYKSAVIWRAWQCRALI